MFLWPGYQEHKAIALWRHLLNAVHTIFFKEPCSPTLFCSLGKLFRSYYIRLRMCAATSIDRIELNASLTYWMWHIRGIGLFLAYNFTVFLFSILLSFAYTRGHRRDDLVSCQSVTKYDLHLNFREIFLMTRKTRKRLRYFRSPPNLAHRKLIYLANYVPSSSPQAQSAQAQCVSLKWPWI